MIIVNSRTMHWFGTVEIFKAPTEYYFYPEINTCKPSRFQDKIHRKACYNFWQGKTGYQTEFNSFVFYLHCFIIRACDLKKSLFISVNNNWQAQNFSFGQNLQQKVFSD